MSPSSTENSPSLTEKTAGDSGPGPCQRRRGAASIPKGRAGWPCETRFRVLRRSTHYTLIECDLLTGGKHQIRRHARLAGHAWWAMRATAPLGLSSSSARRWASPSGPPFLFPSGPATPSSGAPGVPVPAIPPEILRLLEEDQGSEER